VADIQARSLPEGGARSLPEGGARSLPEGGRLRPWQRGALILLAVVGLFRLVAGYVEGKIAARINGVAQRQGLEIRYERLRVGLFPPFQITGLVIEKPGAATTRVESVSVTPRFRGPRGFGLLGRVHLAAVSIVLPAELEATIHPTSWDVDPGHSVILKEPVQGLSLSTGAGSRGRTFDLKAENLDLDTLAALAVEGAQSRKLGAINGEAHAEGDPRANFQATWRFTAFGGETGGSLIVLPGNPNPKTQLQASMNRLDFGYILASLGLEVQEGENSLGTLSGTISASGQIADPKTIDVIQKLTFKAPARRPPAVARLGGGFNHQVTTNIGTKKTIEVSAGSPDFIAFAEVPPLFIRALLIAEDAAFFSHPGIDLTEVPRAIAANIARGGAFRGASTITQQLAKNLFLTREKSLQRKLRELSYSFLLESTLGKTRILEIYLNIIEWGPGLYGLRPAARHYFDKAPQALTPREIAFLVSMIPGPVKYQRSIQGGEVRRGFDTLVNNLLVKLRSVDALSEEEYQAARAETLIFRGYAPDFEAPEIQ